MTFGARLHDAMQARGPLCAGIDPHPSLLDAWGLTDSVNGLEKFALRAAEALGPEVAAVKPQSAFFERFGSRGIAVLERVVQTAQEGGALVVLDVKRGDIGTTAQGYADAYLDPNGAAGRRRDHRDAVPRLRQPRPDDRDRTRPRRRVSSCSP